MTCWGSNDTGQADQRPGGFRTVSAGGNFSCGARPNGTVECWGANGAGQATAPPVAFAAPAVDAGGTEGDGDDFTCGASAHRSPRVLGNNDSRQVHAPPTDPFGSVSVRHPPHLRTEGEQHLLCWGHNTYGQRITPIGYFR